MECKELSTITISVTEFVEVRVTKLEKPDGSIVVDIRQWYSTRKDPEMKPTQKGIRFSIDKLPDIQNAIQAMLDGEELT